MGSLQHVAQRHGAGRRAQIAHRPGQVGGQDPVAHAEALGDGLDRPHVQAGDDGVVDVALGHACVLERRREGLTGQRHVHLLAEALLPDVRIGLTGHPPAVEELVARRPPADHLGHRAVRRADQRGGAVTAVALLGRARQAAAQVRDDGQRGAAATGSRTQRLQQGAHRRARRPREVVGPAGAPQPQRGVHRRGARLVEIPGVRRGEEQVLHRGRPRAHGQRPPAGLDAQRGGVLVVGGHSPGTPAPATAQDAGDG